MAPPRPNESDDESELSDVDVSEIQSVALSDTPRSAAKRFISESPEIAETNRDLESQTIAASSNGGENGEIIDLDERPQFQEKGDQEEGFMTASASPKNIRLSIQGTGRLGEKSITEMDPKMSTPEQSSDTLKRKSFTIESPKKVTTGPKGNRSHIGSKFITPRGSYIPPPAPKADEETARLREVLLHVSTEATQAILREQWRNFLFTNAEDSHITFILRAGLKNANPNVLVRILKDAGVMKEAFVEVVSAKQPIVARVLKNASANQLADLVPSKVLDQALSEHLKSVPAKSLIRWLAEADRLGYTLDDILDENDETVVPHIPSRAQSHDGGDTEMIYQAPRNPEPPSLDPLVAEQQRIIAVQKAQIEARAHVLDDLRCPTCTYKFDTIRGYNYHRSKNICTRNQPPGLKFYCSNCAQGFTTKQGMLYHEKKRVCLGEEGQDDDEAIFQDHLDRPNPVANPSNTQYLTDVKNQSYVDHPHNPSIPGPTHNIPRPPLHTPTISKHISTIIAASPSDEAARQSPSELTPEKRAALEAALQRVEEKYAEDQASIPDDWPADKREARLISLKNGNASRKSQIRKSFGVTLRMRDKDKEAKKRREVLGTSSPLVTAGINRIGDSQNSPMADYSMGGQQVHQGQAPTGVRMEMVDMRPATGFSPINAQPQHYSYSKAPEGPYPVPPGTRGFLPSFPPTQLPSSHPRPGSDHQDNSHGYDGIRDSEDHSNKRLKLNSNAGMAQAEDERSRHFAPSTPASMGMHERSASSLRVKGKVGTHDRSGMLMLDKQRPGSAGTGGMMNGSRPSSAGSGGVGNVQRPIKRVPVGAIQRRWEALNGKGPGRRAEVSVSTTGVSGGVEAGAGAGDGDKLMRSVEEDGRENEQTEDKNGTADITTVGKSKGKEPISERNVVDLVSDESASEGGTAGISGDDS
ncbi:e0e1b36a-5933-49ea-ac31-bc1ff3d20274 [Sclerotinia trifoliorum]|uniref:E0e1b36a-5933-49ea-ac31-bc1ff3d20274 n=1 Tax=Sclerotinia trifoliorum TaxID=28548 RepID=A0A8H2VX22_9HELO|nr:e0e1b36a-5933-49ea-ac31-bc1ff3d20274 [Sclerotinia trifoliorum]